MRVIVDRFTLPESRPPTGTATAELLDLELVDSAQNRTSQDSGRQSAEAAATRGDREDRGEDFIPAPEGGPVPEGAPVPEGDPAPEGGLASDGGGVRPQVPPAPLAAGACPVQQTRETHPDDPFVTPEQSEPLPGSAGEHLLQSAYATEDRARRFYDDQVLDHLNPEMKRFIGVTELAFVATADSRGECDSSLRAGPAGFIEVLGDRHIAYPEYRGNGVMASLGNISENPHVGILLIDFTAELIGLHVNGKARILEDTDLRAIHPDLTSGFERGRKPERWVVVQLEEAYIHCRKHIPRMAPASRQRSWGTDDVKRKGGDFFAAKGTPRPWHQQTKFQQTESQQRESQQAESQQAESQRS